MSSEKKTPLKTKLHPRNKNREPYNLAALANILPELNAHIGPNKFGVPSVNFSNPRAVKLLNRALLHQYYGISYWNFPDENLCPPIPGRADYIHYLADILSESNGGKIPTGHKINCLDIGTGASCIYPILGVAEYGWSFVGTDINPKSVAVATHIVNANVALKGKIECRKQTNPKHIFHGMVGTQIDATLCNPPFHATLEAAQKGTQRKLKNLTGKCGKTTLLNFAGINNELVYKGGEIKFISNMIGESETYAKNVFWFTTLVSKQTNVQPIKKLLAKTKATEIKTIAMGTGNKTSRIVAWTFLTAQEQKAWRKARWQTK